MCITFLLTLDILRFNWYFYLLMLLLSSFNSVLLENINALRIALGKDSQFSRKHLILLNSKLCKKDRK